MISTLQLFKCLSEETRLKSLLLIRRAGELCVCDLTCALAMSQPKVSRHLAELKRCQLVVDDRRGKWVYYRLHPQLPAWATLIIDEALAAEPSYTRTELARLADTSGC
ncbi:metalloregulator ArsR/SmtB family transcription factor [Spongiibacter sp.]|uniref:metalloregulator ArsR/SmtB family transcription factor n=1 Tax=Spongiibacter sp. TaxID=2024860 RepID=UPI00356666E8